MEAFRRDCFPVVLLILILGAKPAMSAPNHEGLFTNRLANETSPYLLQHKNNPVDWYPWGEEALKAAKEEDRPIFLSIGYSACHWCHVMEHESFENPEIAAFLNEHFVNIKVDREERPDLDEIYMTATQLITHSGGWPMSVFLTPDLKPFYAGTYFPPHDMYNRPGFRRLIETLAETYRNRRDEVEASSQNVAEAIKEVLAADTSAATVERTVVLRTVQSMKQRFDPVWGGFGGAPKFPHTMDLMLAMRHYREHKDEEVLHMVTHSLEKMARGGMYDQIAGGFHRYSVDSEWLIPHFEKMLYDNALLSRTYLEAYQLTGREFFATVAREILDYTLREMQDPEGGYYSSTDADSEGEEGKFFVWTPEEIASVLGADDAAVVCSYYNVTDHGNFEHGKSALWVPKDPEEVAKGFGISLDALNDIIARSKPKLLAERARRIPPGLDDKILVDWNGLMISSMAFGAFVLSETRYLESAATAADCALKHQWDGERLLHSRRKGDSRLEGMLSDYANLAMGLIDLYETSLDPKWLEKAIEIHAAMGKKFGDMENCGFFNTLDGQEDLLIRTKTGTDNATPSGNSIAALNALKLGALTGKVEYEEEAQKTLLCFGQGLASQGMAYPMMMNAVDYHHHGGEELILVPAGSQGIDSFLEPLRKRFSPYLVWVSVRNGLEKIAPLVEGRVAVEGKTTAYLCRDRTCQAPTTDPGEVLKRLR